MKRVVDKVAIVTGAGRGIGRAISLALAQEGAHVVVADIDGATAHETADAVEALGCKSLPLHVDLGSIDDIEILVTRTVERFGRIDILVNNAGVTRAIDTFDISPEDWDWIHRVNARGTFF